MMKRFLCGTVLLAILFASAALAHSYKQGDINIGHAWARATAPGVTTAAIYVPFINHGKETDQLIKVSSPIADRLEIHQMTHDNGIMKMEKLDTLSLDPEKPVALRPGGMHIMVFGLKRPLKQGDMVPLTIQFQKAGTAQIQVMVESASAMAGAEP